MSDGTFCRICHRLMVPSREQICVECKDAMKRAGYMKVFMCKDCKHYKPYTGRAKQYFECQVLDQETDPHWFCADGEGEEE